MENKIKSFGSSPYEEAVSLILSSLVDGDSIIIKSKGSNGENTFNSKCVYVDGLLITTIKKNKKIICRIVYDCETEKEIYLNR